MCWRLRALIPFWPFWYMYDLMIWPLDCSRKTNQFVGHTMQPCNHAPPLEPLELPPPMRLLIVMMLWLSDYHYFLSAQFPFSGDRLLLITNHDADISSRAPLVIRCKCDAVTCLTNSINMWGMASLGLGGSLALSHVSFSYPFWLNHSNASSHNYTSSLVLSSNRARRCHFYAHLATDSKSIRSTSTST